MYKIVETFISIQGEGSLQGTNVLFIRTFGCNLSCDFCDEPKHVDKSLIKEYSTDDLVKMAKEAQTGWVCLTGGEPSMQDMNPLIEALQYNGIKVQVETNGLNYDNISLADIKTCAPKGEHVPEGEWTELKILIPVQLPMLQEALHTDSRVYVQPVNYEHEVNRGNLEHCLEIIDVYPQLGLSVQLHKLLGVE